jgi:SAM-dependent methyltransferase
MEFDREYYRRFYLDPGTAVTSRAEMRARADLIAGCIGYLGLPVHRILDAGCGLGLLRAPLLRRLRDAEYLGLECSVYLCRRYGWRRGSIATLRTRERFDLVICYDVLQYLPAAQARRAIANLGRLCRGALYFGALTREDWQHNCDQRRTHRVPDLRSGAWYRRELSRAFCPIGFGLWLRRGLDLPLWNLDAAA